MLADEREPTDLRILRLAHEGRQVDACRLLVEAYGAEILGTCVARMGNPAAGEDAAQDALARALVALPEYRGTAGLRPWLHRIASNRCIDLLRSRRSLLSRTASDVEVDHVTAPEEPLPFEVAEDRSERLEELGRVRAVLGHVKEPDRTWVELHYTHGVSYDEIAADVGLSRAAVKQRIWRAVKRVRFLLGGIGEDGAEDPS